MGDMGDMFYRRLRFWGSKYHLEGLLRLIQLTKNENLRGRTSPTSPMSPPDKKKEKPGWTTPAGWRRGDITDERGNEMKA